MPRALPSGHPVLALSWERDDSLRAIGTGWLKEPAFWPCWRGIAWVRSLLQWRLDLFRAMLQEQDGFPKVARSARALGVRIASTPTQQADICVDDAGCVRPGHGGLSLTIGSPSHLPPHRRPPQFGGIGKDPVFMLTKPFWAAVRIHVDSPQEHHACGEPIIRCPVEQYERELAATRFYWRKVE
jgi:hypothetical protein